MSLMRKFYASCVCVGIVLFISSCEIRKKGAKSEPSYGEQGKAAVISYFILEQAAISNSEFQQERGLLSFLLGRGLVVSETSTFQKWYSPSVGCKKYSADGPSVSLIRSLDVGDLIMRDPGGSEVKIEKNKSEFYFSALGMLNVGRAALSTTGSNGSFVISHNFNVPDMGAQIEIEGVQSQIKKRLPTPRIVAEPSNPNQDPDNYYLSLNRSEAYRLSYQAPASTNFVKLTIQDNTADAANWIVCYGEPGSDIFIPQGTLGAMRATNEALLTLDFFSVDTRFDLPRMKESLVLSYSRHYHGRRDLNDIGINNPAFFGKLSLE